MPPTSSTAVPRKSSTPPRDDYAPGMTPEEPAPGRGLPRELGRDEIDAFLREQRVARLGCRDGDEVYVVP